MIEKRIGIGISDEVNKQFTEVCSRNNISKGFLVGAVLNCLPADVLDKAIADYKDVEASEREQKKAKRKELNKALKTLTPEEIDLILASRKAA